MRTRLLILLAAATAALALSCDQSPPGPTLPTTDVQWSNVTTFSSEPSVVSVWGSSPDNIYAGQPRDRRPGSPHVSRFDGAIWRSVDIPMQNDTGSPIIWGSGEDDVYVATGHLYHFDGSTWTTEPIDADVVTGASGGHVFAANPIAVFEFNGAAWDTLRTMSWAGGIRGFSAAPDGSVFYSASGLISMWDGATWTDTDPADDDFAGPVIAFAKDNALLYDLRNARIYRWDGLTWTVETTSLAGSSGFAATSANDVYAAGGQGRVSHYDGVDWKPLPARTALALYSIAAVGSNIVVGGDAFKVMSWSGSDWQVLHEAGAQGAYGIFAESPSRMLVNDGRSVFEFDHGDWEEKLLPSSFPGNFGGSSLGDVFVGTSHGIFHSDGSSWSLSDSLATYQSSFWRSPAGTMYSVGRGSAYRLTVGTWERIYDGEHDIEVIGGDGGEGIVVAGKSQQYSGIPIVSHFDGTAWQELPPPDDEVSGLWSGPGMDLYVAGYEGLYRWNGVKFRRLSPPHHGFTGVFPLPNGRKVALGLDEVGVYDGFILGLTPSVRRGITVQALDGAILLYDDSGIAAWRRPW